MAFHTIWSVDIGRASLKAVKLRRDRHNIEILAIDKVDYPLGKNGVDASAQAKEALSVFRTRNDVKEPVVVAHPGQGTFYRSIKVPASDDKKVDSMVGYEASQQIPFPLDEVVWDYHVIDRDYLPGEEREVALFAVRREAMDDFLLDFSNEDLAVEVVSIGYLGLLNFVRHDIQPEEPSIILDIGASHTDLVLVDGSRFWIRPLPHSGSDITRAIMSRFKLSYPEAEKLKVESARAPKQAVKIFQAVIQPKLKELVGEIHRSIGYYRSQAGEVNFRHLYLLGNASKIIGIKKFLEEQLGVQVIRVQSISHFRINRSVNIRLLKSHLASFATTLGCGLQALGVGDCRVDLVPREEKLRKELGRKKKHAFVAAGIVLVLMFVAHFMLQGKLDQAKSELASHASFVVGLQGTLNELRRLEGSEGDETGIVAIRKEKEALKQVGETRRLAVDGLAAVESVLEDFPNGRGLLVPEPEDSDESSSAVLASFRDEGLLEQLWLAWFEVRRTTYPETTGSRAAADDKKKTVPAYEFKVFVVVRDRGGQRESNDFIQKRFAGPLEKEIKRRNLMMAMPGAAEVSSSTQPKVVVRPGEPLPRIYKEPGWSDGRSRSSRRSRSTGSRDEAEAVQEGGGFYGAEVTWLLVPRNPPPPEEEPAGEDEGRR